MTTPTTGVVDEARGLSVAAGTASSEDRGIGIAKSTAMPDPDQLGYFAMGYFAPGYFAPGGATTGRRAVPLHSWKLPSNILAS